MKVLLPLAVIGLAACSSHSSNDAAEAQADTLDNAAEQSTGAAADVLHNQADAIRENGANGPAGAPGSSVQNAMQAAGNAQAAATAPAASSSPSSTRQALRSGAEKGTPPPTTDTQR